MLDVTSLNRAVNEFANTIENTWEKNSKVINIRVGRMKAVVET